MGDLISEKGLEEDAAAEGLFGLSNNASSPTPLSPVIGRLDIKTLQNIVFSLLHTSAVTQIYRTKQKKYHSRSPSMTRYFTAVMGT